MTCRWLGSLLFVAVLVLGSPVAAQQKPAAERKLEWPAIEFPLTQRKPMELGTGWLTIYNLGPAGLTVAVRNGRFGLDFTAEANTYNAVRLGGGRYDVYYRFADKPDRVYQGSSVDLKGDLYFKIVQVGAGANAKFEMQVVNPSVGKNVK